MHPEVGDHRRHHSWGRITDPLNVKCRGRRARLCNNVTWAPACATRRDAMLLVPGSLGERTNHSPEHRLCMVHSHLFGPRCGGWEPGLVSGRGEESTARLKWSAWLVIQGFVWSFEDWLVDGKAPEKYINLAAWNSPQSPSPHNNQLRPHPTTICSPT